MSGRSSGPARQHLGDADQERLGFAGDLPPGLAADAEYPALLLGIAQAIALERGSRRVERVAIDLDDDAVLRELTSTAAGRSSGGSNPQSSPALRWLSTAPGPHARSAATSRASGEATGCPTR